MQRISAILGVPTDPTRGESGQARREREARERQAEMARLAGMTAAEAAEHLDRHCPHCGALLTPYEFFQGRFGFGVWRYHDRHGCAEEAQALAAHDAAVVAERARHPAERLTQAGLTGELATASFSTFKARANWKDALALKGQVMQWAAQMQAGPAGRWLVLHGGYGLGKSHLAAACVRQVVEQGEHSAFFRVWPEYLQRLKLSWSTRNDPDGEREADIIAELARGWLVVLDDLDKVNPTDWQREQLFVVLDRRLTDQLPTIITCNARPGPALAQIIGKASADRLLGRALLVGFEGPSFRSGVQL